MILKFSTLYVKKRSDFCFDKCIVRREVHQKLPVERAKFEPKYCTLREPLFVPSALQADRSTEKNIRIVSTF